MKILISIIVLTYPIYAQDSAEELSIKAANPIANLISLPFQNNHEYQSWGI